MSKCIDKNAVECGLMCGHKREGEDCHVCEGKTRESGYYYSCYHCTKDYYDKQSHDECPSCNASLEVSRREEEKI